MKTIDIIRDEYFVWLLSYITEDCETNPWDNEEALRFLYGTVFTWSIPLDENRALNGIRLRSRFIKETGPKDASYIEKALDGPCTVLEMMIALADKIETTIMSNSNYGNRTGEWFWMMIDNLGLLSAYNDDYFDETEGKRIINRFLDREYQRDGRGGLFVLENYHKDLRTAEIWYQMNWYFTRVLGYE